MNRALQGLADSGLLERRRKAGTRVALDPVRKATLEIPVIRLEVEAAGGEYAYRVLQKEIVSAPAPVAEKMDLSPGVDLVHLRGLHTADGDPFLYEERWVNLDSVPEFETADFTSVSPNEWLVRNQPFTRGEISFLAEAASSEQAAALGAAEGAALFAIERTTWNADAAITHVRLAYRQGYRMSTEI